MIDLHSIADIKLLRESVDLECKLAAGRDGKGALPEDFWRTYSAFANTGGGVVLLGVREKQGQFSLAGVEDVSKVRRELFDALNNRQKVSVNVLTDAAVQEVKLDGTTLLAIEIPRANRKQRPVHLTLNPFGGNTYRRLNDGDRALPDDEVKRMIAEQVEDSRDDRVLRGYEFEDLEETTFRAYRQMFANRDPNHPWNVLPDREFLRQIGGWRKDRETGENGVTAAGLLMFGRWNALFEAFPNYFVDFQERPLDYAEQTAWVDRLIPDGGWSGNLFDFYRRVVVKLTADLKVPFILKDGIRQDDTPIHKALREALVNSLVHADFSGRLSILVIKEPGGFQLRNPGGLRVPAEQALQGGLSDCRNRVMQQMFLMIGLGERAGSGMSRIVHGWRDLGHFLELKERFEPQEHTVLSLHWANATPLVPNSSPNSSPKSSPIRHQDTAESILLLLGKNPCMSTRVLGGRIWKLARGPFLNRLRSSKRKTAFAGWGLQKREDGKSFQRIHWMVSHRMLAGVSAPPRASGTLCSTTYPGRPVTCKPRACVPP